MNDYKNRLLSQVRVQLDGICALKACDLLEDSDTRLVAGAPTSEEVKALLPTLKARLENAQRTGKLIYGLEEVIARLASCEPTDVVVGYGFISPRAAGNIYLSGKDEQVLGATIVDR